MFHQHNSWCNNEERPQFVVYLAIFASYNMKLNKLRRHLETSHPKYSLLIASAKQLVVCSRVNLLKQHLYLQTLKSLLVK